MSSVHGPWSRFHILKRNWEKARSCCESIWQLMLQYISRSRKRYSRAIRVRRKPTRPLWKNVASSAVRWWTLVSSRAICGEQEGPENEQERATSFSLCDIWSILLHSLLVELSISRPRSNAAVKPWTWSNLSHVWDFYSSRPLKHFHSGLTTVHSPSLTCTPSSFLRPLQSKPARTRTPRNYD